MNLYTHVKVTCFAKLNDTLERLLLPLSEGTWERLASVSKLRTSTFGQASHINRTFSLS